ncbi:outer membrane protein [Legionella yabuuchiae]|uniref:outer membrane protein n=1 Tax=Legionella yabuuchiae TaxID=376727 RepID=UPI001056D85D|nr:outer membrane beta-barrel protein [Legionella yabuuchiae]
MNSIKRDFITLSLLLACTHAMAYEPWPTKNYTQVITVSGGIAWATPGKDRTIYAQNSVITYDVNPKTQTMPAGEIFLGLQWPFNDCINNQLGIAFGGAGNVTLDGSIKSFGEPTGSRYEYQVGHGFVSARGKMILNPKLFFVQPFLTGSVGVGFNHTFGFRTYPLVDPTVATQWFRNYTDSFVLTYSVGAGLEKQLNSNWSIGVSYEFANWGENGLGRAFSSPWTYEGPQFTNLYAHNLLFSLSYLC